MIILNVNNQVDILRGLCDNSQNRIWISTPFIGSWNAICRIIGRGLFKRNINIRILTDKGNKFNIDITSYNELKRIAEIKSLTALHAKIYIIDNSAIISSANLTEAGFCRRYEAGVYFEKAPKEIFELFDYMWTKAEPIPDNWRPERINRYSAENYEAYTNRYVRQRELPQSPLIFRYFWNFENTLRAHEDFKNIYLRTTGQVSETWSINLEIDVFFEYLYHQHPERPSNIYQTQEYRVLSNNERDAEINNYKAQFREWINIRFDREDYRIINIRLIQDKLSNENIDSLSYDDVSQIVNCLHCMNSLPLNKAKFLNPNNNSLIVIITQWKNLLHRTDIPLLERMETCKNTLYSFGKSSIQELLYWYYPENYPCVNSNSNCGLKFFGYDVSRY